jgi:hypothetical protein
MRCLHSDSLVYLALSLALTWLVLQLAVTPAREPATPLFPTTGHNAALPMDVDGDGTVDDRDVVFVLESVRDLAASLPVPVEEVCTPHPYLDVDGDGFLSEHDAEIMIGRAERIASLAPAAGPQFPIAMQAKPSLARR